MNKKGLIALIVVVVLAVAGVLVFAATNKGSADVCRTTGQNHVVNVKGDKMIPQNTDGSYCDTLTIKDDDNVTREIAFGPHEHHTPYDGITTRILTKGQSFTVTMNQRGTFHFHDHFHDEVTGTFTVK